MTCLFLMGFSDSQVEKWLTDHKIPNPGNLDSKGLRDLVKKNYDSAYDTCKYSIPVPSSKPREGLVDSIRRSYHGAVEAWSDSDLKVARRTWASYSPPSYS
ncbi:hypothetical protein BY996DRAFT_1985406 [Phakopsora pachyrhizi]|nr:hypothetical protein BY996DRAFT_1985406 [Phakopsora pachyrhizi]